MPRKGQKAPEASQPGRWVGSELAQTGSVFLRLPSAKRRELLAWLKAKEAESEAKARSYLT